VLASESAVAAFADLLAGEQRLCSSIVGRADAVLALWDRLSAYWGPARDVRPNQPLLATDALPATAVDPEVRRVRTGEIDRLFPAAVAMYTEEVGVSPLAEDGGRGYRRRVADLVRGRRAYALFVDGEVVFKAELAVVTRRTAQVQGVWVAPAWRGRGMAAAAMAAVRGHCPGGADGEPLRQRLQRRPAGSTSGAVARSTLATVLFWSAPRAAWPGSFRAAHPIRTGGAMLTMFCTDRQFKSRRGRDGDRQRAGWLRTRRGWVFDVD
jgi:GNAT superfamily N-acetyltransferase